MIEFETQFTVGSGGALRMVLNAGNENNEMTKAGAYTRAR